MPLNLAELIRDMDSASRATWNRVMLGDIAALKFREDSITEEILFNLMQRHPQLTVRRFNQHEEKKSGADWEWWVGSGNLGWFRLRIQAKRVHKAAYKELDHRGDIEAGHEFQYQTLIASCHEEATYPFHVFYNGWPENRFNETFESDHETRCGPLDQELWGCAAMSSHTVENLHLGSKDVHWARRSYVPRYMPGSLPWSRLFTSACTNFMDRRPRSVALAGASPHAIFQHMHAAAFVADRIARDEVSADRPDLQNWVVGQLDQVRLHTELPSYAWKAQAAQQHFRSGDGYMEENPNFRVGPEDDPLGEQPAVVLVLDVEVDGAQ